MEPSLEYEMGIVDYRNIIKVIKDTYSYDLTDYALTSLKRRFERTIQLHNIKSPDVLTEMLRNDKLFFDQFIQEIAVESTEMFRDPSFWRFLRDELLPLLLKDNFKCKIWLPACISGEELFTLTIVIKENNWTDRFELFASSTNDLMLNKVKSGYFKGTKIEASSDNYDRYQGITKLADYFTPKGEYALRDTSLIKNVRFIKQNINFDSSPQDIKLIIFRNQLIYFTQGLHDKTLKVFYDSLMTGGYLALGNKEQVGLISAKYYKTINEAESIFKKI